MYRLDPSDMSRLRDDFSKLTEIARRRRSERPGFFFVVAALIVIAGTIEFFLDIDYGRPYYIENFNFNILLWGCGLSLVFLCIAICLKMRLKRDAQIEAAIRETWDKKGVSFGEGVLGEGMLALGKVTDGYVEILHERHIHR